MGDRGAGGYNSKKQYLHLAIDFATRYLWTLSSKTQTAKDFVNLINSVTQIQRPKMILADRYAGINSKEFMRFLGKQKIKLTFISPNYPASNGLCERVNQTIVTRLRCKMNESNRVSCWSKLLKMVTEEYNNSPHSVTGFSPKYLMFGVPPFPQVMPNTLPPVEEARKLACENTQRKQEVNKNYFDNRHQKVTLNPGDLVLVENKNAITRKKLEPLMSGPYKVMRQVSNVLYEIEWGKRGKPSDVVHISKLRLYNNPILDLQSGGM
ncbi:uncharacterized protein LOC111627120 [Centruroides sculpturatus]|uniref:uncharacterized protein LOC111627120 n=1 Tax=Centruroides sculpturatus TaxID=218467 RepID=UPI000C6E3E3F|nr:uncharacterized protein LOC111627120 [Centruroides sculpturatus]